MKKTKLLISTLLLVTMLIGIGGTYAYLTASGDNARNSFKPGNVDITVQENFNPPDKMVVGPNEYPKDVKFKNEGTVTSYARANLVFSDKNVSEISEFSTDGGKTWFNADELSAHLPSGWVAGTGNLTGYYYYTEPLDAGESTPSLITNVRTTFIEKTADTNETINHTPRDYDIYVYVEGLQVDKLDGSGDNTSCENAWNEFLRKKGGE